MREVGKLDVSNMSPEEASEFINEEMASGRLSTPTVVTPLDEAQELAYQAWETSGQRQLNLARRALAISPDCADAYVILGDAARTPEEARRLYQKGVEAGERAIGPEQFATLARDGMFWGFIQTRPYMRARAGLATALWALGETAQVVEHYAELLRLNPSDNQGVRYRLVECLIELGRNDDARALLDRYPDDVAASWAYSAALLAFRAGGAGPRARGKLRAALETNPWVPLYLLGIWPLPEDPPDRIGFGDESEAADYALTAMHNWGRTPGAPEWLATQLARWVETQQQEE